MSAQHSIIAVTGPSGSDTSTVREAFEHIFISMLVKKRADLKQQAG